MTEKDRRVKAQTGHGVEMGDAEGGRIPRGAVGVGTFVALTLPRGQDGGVFPGRACLFYGTSSPLQMHAGCAAFFAPHAYSCPVDSYVSIHSC